MTFCAQARLHHAVRCSLPRKSISLKQGAQEHVGVATDIPCVCWALAKGSRMDREKHKVSFIKPAAPALGGLCNGGTDGSRARIIGRKKGEAWQQMSCSVLSLWQFAHRTWRFAWSFFLWSPPT